MPKYRPEVASVCLFLEIRIPRKVNGRQQQNLSVRDLDRFGKAPLAATQINGDDQFPLGQRRLSASRMRAQFQKIQPRVGRTSLTKRTGLDAGRLHVFCYFYGLCHVFPIQERLLQFICQIGGKCKLYCLLMRYLPSMRGHYRLFTKSLLAV